MMNNFLVINFGDNDYVYPMYELGKFILDEIGFDNICSMIEKDEITEVLSLLARNMVSLYEHSWHMYADYSKPGMLAKEIKRYTQSSYLDFDDEDIYFVEKEPKEWNNSESLIIDFNSNKSWLK